MIASRSNVLCATTKGRIARSKKLASFTYLLQAVESRVLSRRSFLRGVVNSPCFFTYRHQNIRKPSLPFHTLSHIPLTPLTSPLEFPAGNH